MLTIDTEFKNLIPALSADELQELTKSCIAEGIRDRIVVWRNGDERIIVDGHNRYAIAREHGLTYEVLERDFASRSDVIHWMIQNQQARRNLTADELKYLRGKHYQSVKNEHGTNQHTTDKERSGKDCHSSKTRDGVAAQHNVSPRTIQNDAKYAEAVDAIANKAGVTPHEVMATVKTSNDVAIIAELEPEHAKETIVELKKTVESGQSKEVIAIVKEVSKLPNDDRFKAKALCNGSLEKAQILTRLYKGMIRNDATTNGTYDDIMQSGGIAWGDEMDKHCDFASASIRDINRALDSVADYHKKLAMDVKRMENEQKREAVAKSLPAQTYNVIYADPAWQYNNTGVDAAASNHYMTMPTEKICTLLTDINIQIADNAVLFLWVTSPLLEDALSVVKAWGFNYKTTMVWTKTDLKKPGTGFYVRQRHELIFICTRGSFTPLNKNISPPIGSVISDPIQEHSVKPDSVYEIIETLYPECNYLELFARRRREGWVSYGDEIQ